jgi:hypothetical protein
MSAMTLRAPDSMKRQVAGISSGMAVAMWLSGIQTYLLLTMHVLLYKKPDSHQKGVMKKQSNDGV